MKKILLSTVLFAAFFLLQTMIVPTTATAQTVAIKSSTVVWKGYKVAGSHEGTIDLKSGSLAFDGDKLTGGAFVLDMNSLSSTDLSGEYKGKLEGHLKSDDFFGVAKYPTAALKITKVKKTGKNAYKIIGDLTIKGITKTVKFPASIYGKKATGTLKIDRTDFNVQYGSGSFFDNLKDNLIYDELDLVVDLEF